MIAVLPYIISAMVFYSFGEYYSKKYALTDDVQYACFAWLGYAVNALLFFPAIKAYNSLSVLGTVWNLSYVIITICLGRFVFNEIISSTQVVGLALGIIAIILLSI